MPLPWLQKFSENMLKLEVVLLRCQLGCQVRFFETFSFLPPLTKVPKTAQPVADDGNHEELARRAARWEKEGEYVQVGCPLEIFPNFCRIFSAFGSMKSGIRFIEI